MLIVRIVLIAAFLLSGVAFTKAQCPAGSAASGINLVTNGNFEQGDTGFNSDYIPCNTASCLTNQGYYAIGTNPQFYHNNFQGTDHTTGSGNFMIVNGANWAGVPVWCQTITVQPNTLYLFSTWVTSVNASNPASLQFTINGTPLGNTFNAPSFAFGFFWPGWVQYNTSWFSGSSTSATICVTNQNTAIGGNDFGLDDISFVECQCNYQLPAITPVTVCNGTPASLSAASGATSYQWSPAADLNCATCQTVTASPSVTTTYTVIGTFNNCVDSVTAVVTVAPQPSAFAGNDTTICPGQSVTLPGSGGTSYAWSPAAGLNTTNAQTVIATPTATTTYTLVVTGAGGCTATDMVIVALQSGTGPTVSNDTAVCEGQTAMLMASGATTYEWSPSAGMSCATCALVTVTPVASTTYTLTTQTSGCTNTLNVTVTVWPQPVANAGSDVATCANEPVALNGSGGAGYAWLPLSGLSAANIPNPTATVVQTTTYTLSVFSVNGCSDTDDVVVTVNDVPDVAASPDTSVCSGSAVSLWAGGAETYAWSPALGIGTTAGANVIATVTQNIVYTVTGTNASGCTATALVEVTSLVAQTPVTTPDTVVCFGQPFALAATGLAENNWSGPDAQCSGCSVLAVNYPTQSGTYVLSGVDLNGCSASADVLVAIDNTCELLLFPNAFSPNGDNLNDIFRPVMNGIRLVTYRVYNRWGQLMYEGIDAKGWNGRFKNMDQPIGTYIWHATAQTVSGQTIRQQGHVTLIR